MQFKLGEIPSKPPPLRGMWARFAIDGMPEKGLELAWLQKDNWSPRDEALSDAAAIARSTVTAKTVTMTPPPIYSGERAITWALQPTTAIAAQMRRECLS